jgi:hypothetical protein
MDKITGANTVFRSLNKRGGFGDEKTKGYLDALL